MGHSILRTANIIILTFKTFHSLKVRYDCFLARPFLGNVAAFVSFAVELVDILEERDRSITDLEVHRYSQMFQLLMTLTGTRLETYVEENLRLGLKIGH